MAACSPGRRRVRCHVIPSRFAIRKSGCCPLDQPLDEPGPFYPQQRAVHAGTTGVAEWLSGWPVCRRQYGRSRTKRFACPACRVVEGETLSVAGHVRQPDGHGRTTCPTFRERGRETRVCAARLGTECVCLGGFRGRKPP